MYTVHCYKYILHHDKLPQRRHLHQQMEVQHVRTYTLWAFSNSLIIAKGGLKEYLKSESNLSTVHDLFTHPHLTL